VPSSQSQYFSASFDSTTKVVSTVVCLLLIVMAVVTKIALVAGLGAAILIVSYAFSVRGYAIQDRSVIVNRFIGNVRLPLDGIRELRAASADDFRGCVRLWGNGGLFGYYGLFRTSKLGKCSWYLTDRSKAVVIVSQAKTVLCSPDDVTGFITAIQTYVTVPPATSSAPLLDAAQSYGIGRVFGKVAGAVIAIAALGFAALAVLYSPGPPALTLTHDALTIHDRFYPVTLKAADVDVENIRVVDTGLDADWRPTARTNGFANSHYRSGWFRVASGKTVRMYRANGTRLVLLPPRGDGAAVLLETGEPEQFVRNVQREWSQVRGQFRP
jgi:hypothetical protein